MSKKQGTKKKINLKINQGQAAFVASVEVLQHIAETYAYMASCCETKEEAQSWSSVSEDISTWINNTYHSGQEDDLEEEW